MLDLVILHARCIHLVMKNITSLPDSFYRNFHSIGQPIVVFRPAKARSNEDDESFTGDLKSYDELSIWSTDKCVPLVREITFENAEELTEEGLPFLILFYHPDDNSSIKKFNEIITTELLDEKRTFSVPYYRCRLKLAFQIFK
jgi:hypothetical protein